MTPNTSGFVSKAAELSEEQNFKCCVWIAAKILTETERKLLERAGADVIYHFPVDTGDCHQEIAVRNLLAEMAHRQKPEVILFLSSIFMQSVAPGVAALLHTGITADCSSIYWDISGKLTQCRPTFGGRKLAIIQTVKYPVIATVRSGVFSKAGEYKKEKVYFEQIAVNTPPAFCEYVRMSSSNFLTDIRNAEIILAGGAGIGSKKIFDKLYILAERLKCEVAASRGAVAGGYASYDRQVGQTGLVVCPKVYVAFGISGAVQHLCGIMEAEKIIAVNPDREAPIHQVSDYSIYEDADKVIDMLLGSL